MSDPIYERTVQLPAGYVLTARLRQRSIFGTLIRLLPWAVFVMVPSGGRGSRLALRLAKKVSPLVGVKR